MAKVMRVESGDDRISALPDLVLSHILSFLPIKMAVRTSVLSKRWKFPYTLVPCLDFDTDIYEDSGQFASFVDRILLIHSRPSIQRFRLKLRRDINFSKIHRWIYALMDRNIQELELFSHYSVVKPCGLQLPASLFSCGTLVVLKLIQGSKLFSLKIPSKTSLPNLKVLHIWRTILSGNSVGSLLSSCPVLDDLALHDCHLTFSGHSLTFNISNALLKRLSIRFCLAALPKQAIQILVDAPALVCLDFVLSKMNSLALTATQSLAKVRFGHSLHPRIAANCANAIEQDVLKEMKNIQSLQIHQYLIQGLYDQSVHLPLFSKMTRLKIQTWGFVFDPRCLNYLLARCVVLETLIFEQHAEEDPPAQSKRIQYLLQQSPLTAMLCHLKVIKIHLFNIEYAEVFMRIIELLLENAEVLEELTVLVRDFPDTQQLEIMRELLTLPRSSKKCKVFVGKWRGWPCLY